MAMHSKWLHGALVFFEKQRWFDAIGPNVVKVIDDFQYGGLNHAAAAATGDIDGGWLLTTVEAGAGDNTVTQQANAPGGVLRITTDAAENDGVCMQVVGESFDLSDEYPLYFGIKFKFITDATQCDVLAGIGITSGTALGGISDAIYFEKLDGSTTLNFVLEKNNTETTTAYGTAVAADTWYIAEFIFNGTTVDWWIDGVAQTAPATTNLPNDEHLSPIVHYLTGEANANSLDIDWIKVIQIQA
jgi:hypothetical protein